MNKVKQEYPLWDTDWVIELAAKIARNPAIPDHMKGCVLEQAVKVALHSPGRPVPPLKHE